MRGAGSCVNGPPVSVLVLTLPAKILFISLQEDQTPAIPQTKGPGELKTKHQGCSEITLGKVVIQLHRAVNGDSALTAGGHQPGVGAPPIISSPKKNWAGDGPQSPLLTKRIPLLLGRSGKARWLNHPGLCDLGQAPALLWASIFSSAI